MVKRCLIDSDILAYELGFASEASWKYSHPEASFEWLIDNPPPFDVAEEQLLFKIAHIEETCGATEPSLFFFTGATNFRNEIAKTQKYKARPSHKPYHYKNIKAYIKGIYPFREMEGLEADDLLAMFQSDETIICSRDKDLRQVAGWHFGWELNLQPQFGPYFVDGYGHIELDSKKKLRGWGPKFFLAQCITGDTVDSIPGLPNKGPKKALEALDGTSTYAEGLEAVREAYKPFGGDDYLLEQGRLLHMTRELHEDGSPVLWEIE